MMLILSVDNEIKNTDFLSEEIHYGVLSFKDFKNPDFFFPKLTYLEEFTSTSITLTIGDHELVMPLGWSVLCTDLENIQSIPLYEMSGTYSVFCLNPINGFMPEFLPMRLSTIFPSTTWTAPPAIDKNMIVVPLGRKPTGREAKSPLCVMFSPSKVEINRPISDIW